MQSTNKKYSYLLFFVVLILTSCASHRLGQFKTFSSAGKAYTAAMLDLLDEAGTVAIDADSEILAKDRALFSEDERSEKYQAHTAELREYGKILSDFRKQTLLLNDYFSVIATMADLKTGENIGAKTEIIVSELGKIHPKLENAKIGDATVKDFLGASLPLIVANLRKKVLEEELIKNSRIIGNELDLQNAVVSALATEIKADLDVIVNYNEMNMVARPFIKDEELPENWKTDRQNILKLSTAASSVDCAENAANELKTVFNSLINNNLKNTDFDALFSDINSMIDLVELVKQNSLK